LALGAIFAAAVLFRLTDLGTRCLWTDEAWVALAALESSPAAALAAGKSTPPFYLLGVWAAVKLWGNSEAVLRSLSFCFGVGTVALFWLLARTLTSLSASLLSLALVAGSPIMVYYAKELKQYSGDAFFAVLVLLLTERLRGRGGEKGWTLLFLAGALGLGFSHALIFTLPIIGIFLWFGLPSSRRLGVILLGGLWALSFAALYWLFLRHQVDPELVAYWAPGFPDFSGVGPFCRWLGAALQRYLEYFLGEWGVFWGLPLLIAGMVILVRQGSSRALLYLGGPLLMTLAASALHRYPFMADQNGNRLMLYSVPLLFLVVSVGLSGVLAYLWQRRQRLAALALAGLILLSLDPLKTLQENLSPRNFREELKPLVAYLEDWVKPQDWVYVYYYAIYPFKYYYRGNHPRIRLAKACAETDLTWPEAGVSPPRRLWLVAGHFGSMQCLRRFAAGLLGPQWEETVCLTREGAALICFERTDPAVAAVGHEERIVLRGGGKGHLQKSP
jgi:4-amino-4-deoxy-L-arabinose transferase-like glycosyltransferase